VPRTHPEPLQLVKYGPTEHFHFHTDWFPPRGPHAAVDVGGNRVSSFFVYVQVEPGTTGGGTNFPRLDAPADERWCTEGIVDCDEPWDNGLTFRPVEGNAVFWVNLEEDGRGNELSVKRGDERTLHAGLPVVTGGKVGMNIWTREGPVGEDIRGTGL
jgi:prolyl 4-hydroxylase